MDPDHSPIKPVIILVRPQLAENIGMCARAMANFGLSEMRLVAPRDGWPQQARMKKGAVSAAAGATSILENAVLFPDVASAIADLDHVFATTARNRGQAKPVHAPASAMSESATRIASGQRIGVMYGPERAGLDNEDVVLASALITFPVNPDFSSLNLAQAVLLTGYEWFRAAHGDVLPFDMPSDSPPAKRETLLAFFEFLETQLDRVRFFFPLAKRPVMVRNMRNIIHRMNPSEQDVRTMRGALNYLIQGGKKPPTERRSSTLPSPNTES